MLLGGLTVLDLVILKWVSGVDYLQSLNDHLSKTIDSQKCNLIEDIAFVNLAVLKRLRSLFIQTFMHN